MGEEKGRKRKRGGGWGDQKGDKWEERMEELKKEMEGLFGYYRELLTRRPPIQIPPTTSLNGMVGILMEESDLPLSELVPYIYDKLKSSTPLGEVVVTPAVVKSAVLSVGQRVSYGLPDVNADPLEDRSPSSLWCWQTRDLKLLPMSLRAPFKHRRTCRQKIYQRLTAISALIKALQNSSSDHLHLTHVTKASVRLSKALAESDIRLLADAFLHNSVGIQRADSEVDREVKQLEKNKKQEEREKKRAHLLLLKETRQNEKEQKRLLEEAEKDEKRREREESEVQKHLRKQQDGAEKERRCREKEDAEMKKRLAVQKQVSIMERFLKKTKTNIPCQDVHTSNKPGTCDPPNEQKQSMSYTTTLLMDCTLSSNDGIVIDDIRKSQLSCWRQVGHSIRLNKKQHWSLRQKPKTELYKELKLMATGDLPWEDESAMEKIVSGFGDQSSDDRSWLNDADMSSSHVKKYKRKQLLQFDKSYRPAFYGIWPKKSCVVGPRHPFKKDPDLDYDVDSDEEWEEDEPGESLSDCDKDDEEEILEGCSKTDDEESEDGFFVPDGYLSDNEGVQVNRLETDPAVEETRRSLICKEELESKEFRELLAQQKYLNNLTDTALRKNQPLVISNLMHEKLSLLVAEDLTGTPKLDKMCLQSLSICAFPGLPVMCISADENLVEYEDACPLNGKASFSPMSTSMAIQDSDMPIVVSAVQSCSQSIGKVVESLQQKFPTVSKLQLKNTVRQISDYVDNRWQVKKEILDEAGLSTLAEKGGGRMQNISSFYSKRCLPPADQGTNLSEISPEPK